MEKGVIDRDVPYYGGRHYQERGLSTIPQPPSRLPRPSSVTSPEASSSPPARREYTHNSTRAFQSRIPSRASLSPVQENTRRFYTSNMERPSPQTNQSTYVLESRSSELATPSYDVKSPISRTKQPSRVADASPRSNRYRQPPVSPESQMRQPQKAIVSPISQTRNPQQPVVSPVSRQAIVSPASEMRQPPRAVHSPPSRTDNASKYTRKNDNRAPRAGADRILEKTPAQQKARVMKQNTMSKSTSRTKITPLVVRSPVLEKPDTLKERRFVSTPSTLPSHKKENLAPLSLMRPISPTQAQSQVLAQSQPLESLQTLPPRPLPLQPLPSQPAQSQPRPTLTKSRTVNALSNIRQTFHRSRSTHHLQPRQSSSPVTSTVSPVDEDADEYTPDNPGPYMWGTHPNNEWLGRFVAVENRFRNEFLQMSLENGPALQEYINNVGKYPELSKPKAERVNDYTKNKQIASEANAYRAPTPLEQTERLKFMGDDEKSRAKRGMDYLSTLCKDDAARKSFLLFQTTYAKVKKMPELLPESSRMERLFGKVGTKFDAFKSKQSNHEDEN